MLRSKSWLTLSSSLPSFHSTSVVGSNGYPQPRSFMCVWKAKFIYLACRCWWCWIFSGASSWLWRGKFINRAWMYICGVLLSGANLQQRRAVCPAACSWPCCLFSCPFPPGGFTPDLVHASALLASSLCSHLWLWSSCICLFLSLWSRLLYFHSGPACLRLLACNPKLKKVAIYFSLLFY